MSSRSEGAETPEKTAWRGLEGAEAYLIVRRAPGRSTRCIIAGIGVRSSEFMNNPG